MADNAEIAPRKKRTNIGRVAKRLRQIEARMRDEGSSIQEIEAALDAHEAAWEQKKQDVIAMAQDGWAVVDIVRETEIPKSTVYLWTEGIKSKSKKRRKRTLKGRKAAEARELAIAKRLQGFSLPELEAELGINRSTLHYWFRDVVLSEEAKARIQSRRELGAAHIRRLNEGDTLAESRRRGGLHRAENFQVDRDYVRRMRAEGWSPTEIVFNTGVPKRTVAEWLQDKGGDS